MKTLYHNLPINSSGANQDVELYSSYEGIVRKRTPSGCIVELQLENGKSAMSYVFGGWSVGSQVLVYITKLFEDDDDLTVETFAESENEEIRLFYKKHRKVVQLAVALKDTVRGYGKHAAGVCISNHNLADGINGNLAKRQGMLVSNWDKDEGEFMGLMKLDCLGLTALSRIRVCCEMIKENHGVDIVLHEIDVEDKNSLKTINKGDCVGIFQLGTYGLTKFCQELGIHSFKDVYNATALFRPGTLGSGMAMEFVKRRHGEPYEPIHAKVEPLTRDTEGIILYQEQCMFLFKELAGFDWGKCSKVRKVIAKSKGEEALEVFKNDFIEGCIKTAGMKEVGALKVWNTIVDFSKYAFNLSHSVEYSIISMWDAYLKTWYPGEFYASCLSYLDEDKRMKIIEEAADRGIGIILPKFAFSSARYWKYNPSKNLLVMPFSEIEGVGQKTAVEIENSKKKVRKTFFGNSVNLGSVPSSVRSSLNRIKAEDPDWKPNYKEAGALKDLFKYNLKKILFS
jgi:DNA polymerase-3 subunit alpha